MAYIIQLERKAVKDIEELKNPEIKQPLKNKDPTP